MNIQQAFRRWWFHKRPNQGFTLMIKRYEASLLDPDFLATLRFMRNSDDWIKHDLRAIPGFKWKEEVDQWMKARNCQCKVDIELRPPISEQKHDRMIITFMEEQDRLEFKLTFL